MKKLTTLFLFMVGMAVVVNAQDIITLKNGNEIKAKVTEISASEIKYKRFDYLDGPTILIAKREVFAINYENGTREVFNAITTPAYRERHNIDNRYGYEGIIDFGYGVGLGDISDFLNFSTTHGFRFNPYFSMGFRVGLRYYYQDRYYYGYYGYWYKMKKELVLPFSMHFKGTFLPGKVAPFIALGVGYSIRAVSDNDVPYGLIFNPSVGVQFRLARKFGMNFSIGYDGQFASNYNYDSYFGHEEIIKLHSALTFKFGLMFL